MTDRIIEMYESQYEEAKKDAYDAGYSDAMESDVIKGAISMQESLDNLIETFWDDMNKDDRVSADLLYDILRQYSVKHCKEVEDD